MTMEVSQHPASLLANGTSPSPSPAQQEQLYDQILRLRDVVLTGKHAQFKLPPSAVEQLKASLNVPSAGSHVSGWKGIAANGQAFATNTQQQAQALSSSYPPLPGLTAAHPPLVNGGPTQSTADPDPTAVSLDPIFLQKSDNLVREEARLKRQRLERDLVIGLAKRKSQYPRDKDVLLEAPPEFDVDMALLSAMQREKHVSGLKAPAGREASSSFDENDYYSSLVQSDWSSNTSSTKGSDRAIGAFNDDFERLDGSASRPRRAAKPNASKPMCAGNPVADPETVNGFGVEEDDDYTPPDAAAFDSSRAHAGGKSMQHATSRHDDSDYEPGEITGVESLNPSPRYQPQQQLQAPAHVPVIRNHLTHIAAPQPNRVSPLTTTNDSNFELELVNGRPEVVRKPSYQAHHMSRVSSASPTGQSGAGNPRKQKKQKKRKRDNEPHGRNKRRQKQTDPETPRSPGTREPYIKPEPMSPPPFMPNVPPAPQHEYAPPPAQVDLTAPRMAPPQQYQYDPQPGYRYPESGPAHIVRVASPAQRPVQRDTQDLRRVASLHNARRPSPPRRDVYSPVAPYHSTSSTYGDPRLHAPSQELQPRSPAVSQRYDEPYLSRAASPALMPPPPLPAVPARRVVKDQHGNMYYAAESAALQPSTIRASAVPESWERAPSRASFMQPPPPPNAYYGRPTEMPPPPQQPTNLVEETFEYVDDQGYIVTGTRRRPAERPPPRESRYSEAPTSPSFQDYRSYEPAMPPSTMSQQPRHPPEPTSPTYDSHAARSYPVHPEASAPPSSNYLRQASVAPVQYMPLRQESAAASQYAPQQAIHSAAPVPQRAMSVMPAGYGYPGAQQQPSQTRSQAPPRYVDQYGNPVFPQEVREVRQMDDYYHA